MDTKNGGIIEVGAVRIDATDENNAYISFGATVIKAKSLFVAISGLLALIFFMPIFRIPVGRLGTQWTNGATVLFGSGNNRGVFSIIFILLMPVLVILLFHFKEKVEEQIVFVKDNLFVIVAASYGFSFFMLWVSRASVRMEYGFMARGTTFFGFFVLVYLAVIAFSVLWALSSKGMGFKIGRGGEYMSNDFNQQPEVVIPPGSYVGKRRDGVALIVFSIITCGIYMFYWYYVTMEDINRAMGKQRINSTALLIAIICCAPVAWYALYQIDKNLATISREHGTHYKGDNFILWLLLSLVAGVGIFVAMYQVSGALNAIWDKREGISRS
ncbi:MAG: DUF4234 domain-containing protein [Defluviitaleaceae bacterium]|nr:DUF4234 domain-containing protein [Defluviitaleaceae bacterium]